MENVISLQNVYFEYEKNTPILKGVNFDIEEGKTIGIVGSNGAGKSTLIKIIVGLLMTKKGDIIVKNTRVTEKNLNEIRRKIGYAFQDSNSQLFMPTVYEDVAFGPRQIGQSEQQVEEIVDRVLEKVNSLHLKHRPPYQLSGGEKRIVALATVLAMMPEIILLDEPTTGLDPKSRRSFIQLMNSLDETKIIATHDMDMVLDICDEVIVLHEGEIRAIGTPKEIFSKTDLLESCQLEKPLSMQGCSICQNR